MGDRIRLLAVPACDLIQRQQEIVDNVKMAGQTADTIERMLASHPVVTISRVDEYGALWFDVELVATNGDIEFHSLTILDDDSWEHSA